MKQHIAHDPRSTDYARGLESVWQEWEPSLRRIERMLRIGTLVGEADGEQVVEGLRQAQYHAHATSELLLGLRPPLAAVDANEHLFASLDSCRETLGAIAQRAADGEMDDFMGELGLRSARGTRAAFEVARTCSSAIPAGYLDIPPVWIQPDEPASTRVHGLVLWGLVLVCATLFGVLLFQAIVWNPAAS